MSTVGGSSPHDRQFDDADDAVTTENFDLLCQLEKECHDKESSILQLKMQLLNERKRFEEEKQEMIAKQDELYYQASTAEVFHSQLCSLLEVNLASEHSQLIEEIQNRIGKTIHREEEDSTEARSKEATIAALDSGLRKAIKSLESSISDNIKLQKCVKKRDRQLREASAQLECYLEFTGQDTIEGSLKHLRKLKKNARRYRKMVKAIESTDNLTIGGLCRIIDDQSALIDDAANSLRKTDHKAASELKKRNRDLSGEMSQILNGAITDDVPEIFGRMDSDLEEQYDDMKTTIWLNKVKEGLALDRQIQDLQEVGMNNSERMKLRMQMMAVREANWLSPGVPFPSTYV